MTVRYSSTTVLKALTNLIEQNNHFCLEIVQITTKKSLNEAAYISSETVWPFSSPIGCYYY